MGKTYKKIVRNKFEKQKLNNLKKKQFEEDYEDEYEEDETLSEVQDQDGTRKDL